MKDSDSQLWGFKGFGLQGPILSPTTDD